jgi:predicted phage terminase large subunit-like protein
VVPPTLHHGQAVLSSEARRFNVPCLGRRFGKTAFCTWEFARPALEGKPVAWFAPTYKILDETWSRMERALAPLTRRRDTQQKRLELKTGGVLEFWTLDIPDPARSRAYARVVIDEAAMVPKLRTLWEQSIRPTLTDYQGDAWFPSTPKPRALHDGAAFFRELYERGQAEDGDWKSWRMPSVTNPYLSTEEIEAARLELPELVFRQEYLAEFVDFEGGLVKREHLRFGNPPSLDQLEIVVGVDLAISTKETADWTAVATIGRHRASGEVWILSVRRARMGFRDAMAMIHAEASRWKPSVVGVEMVQYQAAAVQELLRTTTLPVRGINPGGRDKLTRFFPLVARFEQGMVRLADGLADAFLDELVSFPGTQHDDQVDACSTAWECFNVFTPTAATSANINL